MSRPRPSKKVTWRQIRDDLRADITNRVYLPGQQLPSASALMARYGVARQTAQSAFDALGVEGLVVSRPGAGVFVRVPPVVNRLARRRFVFRDEIGYYFDEIAQGYRPIGTPTVHVGPAPDEIARRLRIEPGSNVVIRSRVLGEPEPPLPLQIAVSYLPAWLAAELPIIGETNTGPGGIYDRIEQHYDAALEWEEAQGAVAASDHEASLLDGVTLGGPLVRITRTAALPDGRPVEVNDTRMDANRFEIVAVLERHDTATWPPAPATETPHVTQPGKAE